MGTQISVARALRDIDNITSKITRAFEDKKLSFISVGGKVNGTVVDKKQIEDKISSNIKSISDMIEHRAKLKKAVTLSNANTYVETLLTGRVSVAEAIEMKSFINIRVNELSIRKRELAEINNVYHSHENRMNAEINTIVSSAVGSGNSDSYTVDIEAISKPIVDRLKPEMYGVDELREYIEDLENKILDFKSEVDYIINESNALTMIEI